MKTYHSEKMNFPVTKFFVNHCLKQLTGGRAPVKQITSSYNNHFITGLGQF
uniref:Uncharacterized protein n=1 Tax=Klebsiella pneumoniae TaxID=573 RepID=A0A1J0QZG9_KLEPN|nr:hypothetical protein [Klebsiella pneumoniae]